MDQENLKHLFQEVVFEPVTQPYSYQLKYFMADGREFEGQVQQSRANPMYVNDPFTNMKEVTVQAIGDLDNVISTIQVELKYDDDENDYHVTKSIALSKNQSEFLWAFPVIRQTGGRISYSFVTNYRNAPPHEEPEREATKSIILVGDVPVAFLEVSLVPLLIDWGDVKLVKVEMHYTDPGNGLDLRQDFLFKDGAPEAKWAVGLKNASLNGYEYRATYFLTDGTKRGGNQWTQSNELTLILELPAA
jgi:hypothetical protein